MSLQQPLIHSSSNGHSHMSSDSNHHPDLGHHLIAFVNGNSGGKAGAELLSFLQKRLGADRVVNLGTTLPRDGLRLAAQNGLRVVACGGDGTVNWLLSTINALHLPKPPPVVIVPLGTGNDTARQFGWGNKWEGAGSMMTMLKHSVNAPLTDFDRWHVEIQHEHTVPDEIAATYPAGLSPLRPDQTTEVQFYHSTAGVTHEEKLAPLPPATAGRVSIPSHRGSDADAPTHAEIDVPHTSPLLPPIVGPTIAAITLDEKQVKAAHDAANGSNNGGKKKKDYTRCEGQWNNYLSFGVDAQVTYSYHHHRETNRGCYCCRCCNMTWMFCCGCMACMCCTAVATSLKLEVRDAGSPTSPWQNVPLPQGLRALVFLNLRTYAGGRDVWPRQRDDATKPGRHLQRMDDGYLEVFGISNTFHLGRIVSDCSNGLRLTQCTEARVTSALPMFVQLDGEPWHDTPSVYHIRRLASAQMVVGPRATNEVKSHARVHTSGLDVPMAETKSTFLTVDVPATVTTAPHPNTNTTSATPTTAAAAPAPTPAPATVTVTGTVSSSTTTTAPSTVAPLVS